MSVATAAPFYAFFFSLFFLLKTCFQQYKKINYSLLKFQIMVVQLMGNVVQDATTKTVKNDKQVINFSIALNYEYKKAGELVKLPSFIDCQYWKNSNVYKGIVKGREVIVFGRIFPHAYQNKDGEIKGVIRFKVDKIFLGEINEQSRSQTDNNHSPSEDEVEPVSTGEPTDDLPF